MTQKVEGFTRTAMHLQMLRGTLAALGGSRGNDEILDEAAKMLRNDAPTLYAENERLRARVLELVSALRIVARETDPEAYAGVSMADTLNRVRERAFYTLAKDEQAVARAALSAGEDAS